MDFHDKAYVRIKPKGLGMIKRLELSNAKAEK